MALKQGTSQEVVSENIRELVRSGKSPKSAIAIALTRKHKYSQMGDGGFVEGESEGEVPPEEASEDIPPGTTPPAELPRPLASAQAPSAGLSDAQKAAVLYRKQTRTFR